MTDEEKKIVGGLREYAKRYADPYYCGGKLIDDTVWLMEQAADMIEVLSAQSAAGQTWKRRCQAAEKDIEYIIHEAVHTAFCVTILDANAEFHWRGPCEANGGKVYDAAKAESEPVTRDAIEEVQE